jgi:hypothetical protein
MKLLPQEIRRIRQNALLVKKVSPSTQQVILTKDLNTFTKDFLTTLNRKKRIKNAMVVVLETGEEE